MREEGGRCLVRIAAALIARGGVGVKAADSDAVRPNEAPLQPPILRLAAYVVGLFCLCGRSLLKAHLSSKSRSLLNAHWYSRRIVEAELWHPLVLALRAGHALNRGGLLGGALALVRASATPFPVPRSNRLLAGEE